MKCTTSFYVFVLALVENDFLFSAFQSPKVGRVRLELTKTEV